MFVTSIIDHRQLSIIYILRSDPTGNLKMMNDWCYLCVWHTYLIKVGFRTFL